MTTVVPFQGAHQLTKFEMERVEQLVWTEDGGRGWRTRQMNSSDSHCVGQAINAFGERQEPTDRARIIAHLARLANHFRSERPADAWQMLFEDYAADLDGISEGHIRDVIATHRKERSWFPKIAELTERWNAMKYREAEQLRRARVLMGAEDPKPWEAA